MTVCASHSVDRVPSVRWRGSWRPGTDESLACRCHGGHPWTVFNFERTWKTQKSHWRGRGYYVCHPDPPTPSFPTNIWQSYKKNCDSALTLHYSVQIVKAFRACSWKLDFKLYIYFPHINASFNISCCDVYLCFILLLSFLWHSENTTLYYTRGTAPCIKVSHSRSPIMSLNTVKNVLVLLFLCHSL